MHLSPAPFFAEIAKGPADGQAQWVITEDGLRIRVGHWSPAPASGHASTSKGTIFIFPGRTEYIEKYGPTAVSLTQEGYHVVSIDWRGQGVADRLLNDRRLGHVSEFLDYQKDVTATLEYAKANNLPKPWFLIGHSMGGAIGLRALLEGLPVRAAAFTAPMWGIRIPALMKPLAMFLRKFASPLGVSQKLVPTTAIEQYVMVNGFEGNTLTNDPDMYRFLQDQMAAQPDLALGGPTIHWLSQAMSECEDMARAASPDIPCLTFLGGNEQIVQDEAIHNRMKRWPKGALIEVPGAQHEVLLEERPIRRETLSQISALFAEHAD